MFGVAKICTFGAEDRNQGGGGGAPIIVSVDDYIDVGNGNPFFGAGFSDCLTLAGGPIVEADTEYLYTHFTEDYTSNTPPAFPGPDWTAYTQTVTDRAWDWDFLGGENGPLEQPPAAGPYTGANPWNDAMNITNLKGDGGGRWRRCIVTVKNASGQDSAAVLWHDEFF